MHAYDLCWGIRGKKSVHLRPAWATQWTLDQRKLPRPYLKSKYMAGCLLHPAAAPSVSHTASQNKDNDCFIPCTQLTAQVYSPARWVHYNLTAHPTALFISSLTYDSEGVRFQTFGDYPMPSCYQSVFLSLKRRAYFTWPKSFNYSRPPKSILI